MLRGTRRLLLLRVPTGLRSIAARLPTQRKLALSRSPYASAARCSTTARPARPTR